jgi:hypothetical protein
VISVIAALLLVQEPLPPVNQGSRRYDVGAEYTLWVEPFDFIATTATSVLDVQADVMQGAGLFARMRVIGGFWAGISADVTFGFGGYAATLSPEFVFRAPLFDAIWEIQFRGRFLGGWMAIQNAPGDFDPGFGGEATIGVCCSPERNGWQGRFEVGVRLLKFTFNPDSDVLVADDEIGGLGLVARIGLEYWF